MTMTKAILAMAVLVGVMTRVRDGHRAETRVVTGQVTDESGAPVANPSWWWPARSSSRRCAWNTTSAGGAR
jgi:hypothetical protein